MDRWRKYLFECHSEAQLRAWARRLGMFRVCRAYGGHANDADSLDVTFPYEGSAELVRFCASLQIQLVHFAERPPQPEPGVPYRGDEYGQFPSLIPSTQWLQQPGHCQLAGQKVFAWCDRGVVRISIGSGYTISEADVSAAELVERTLSNASLKHRDPPTDNEHCICPKFYPEYFG